MKVVKPGEKYDPNEFSIFLAGDITGWREHAIDRLTNECGNGMIFDPVNKEWGETWGSSIEDGEFKKQLEWEIGARQVANIVMFGFSGTTEAPISLLELGLEAGYRGFEEEVIAWVDPAYRYRGYVEYFAQVYDTLDEALDAVISHAKSLKQAALMEIMQRFDANSVISCCRPYVVINRQAKRFLDQYAGGVHIECYPHNKTLFVYDPEGAKK